MKTINRDKIQRMVGQVAGGGGGGGSVDLSGYATQAWVEQNYISKKFFSSLLKIYNGTDTDTNEIKPNAELPANKTNVNIKAMFGFWTQQYLSSLGKNGSSGGGGGSSTLAGLLDVELNNPQDGQVLVYRNYKWVNEDAPQPGGGGSVNSVGLSMPTGFSVSGTPVTGIGTFQVSFASGYSLPATADVNKGVTAYGWGNHATQNYLKDITLNLWGNTVHNNDTVSGDITINNGSRIYIRDKAHGDPKSCLTIDSSNNLVIGEGMADANIYHTYLRGWDLTFQVYSGGDRTALTIDSNGLVTIVQNDQGIKIGDAYIVWDSVNQALKVTGAGGAAMDFYATGGVSALGYSS